MILHNRNKSLFRVIALAMVCLFLVNDIAWANPSDLVNPSKSATLAPELRLDPFIDKHLKSFQDRAALMNAIGELRKLIVSGKARQNPVVIIDKKLCKKLNSDAIEIDRIITPGSLPSGIKYGIAVFNFKKQGKRIEVVFFRDYADKHSLTAEDRGWLSDKFGINNDADLDRLDSPGLLHGVWFVNSKSRVLLPQVPIEMFYNKATNARKTEKSRPTGARYSKEMWRALISVTPDVYSYDQTLKNAKFEHFDRSQHPLVDMLKEEIKRLGAVVWADVEPGYGLALREGKYIFGDKIRTYGVDPSDLCAGEIAANPDLRARCEKILGFRVFDECHGYTLLKTEAEKVRFPERPDIITAYFSPERVKGPWAAVSHLYNQLKPGGRLIVFGRLSGELAMEGLTRRTDLQPSVIDAMNDLGIDVKHGGQHEHVLMITKPDDRQLHFNLNFVGRNPNKTVPGLCVPLYMMRQHNQPLATLKNVPKRSPAGRLALSEQLARDDEHPLLGGLDHSVTDEKSDLLRSHASDFIFRRVEPSLDEDSRISINLTEFEPPVRLDGNKRYRATLGSCVAVIIFNKDGRPVKMKHLQTSIFSSDKLYMNGEDVIPDNRYLIIQGPQDSGGYQAEYILHLKNYLKRLGVPGSSIYVHSENQDKSFWNNKGFLVIAGGGRPVKIYRLNYNYDLSFKVVDCVEVGINANTGKLFSKLFSDSTLIEINEEGEIVKLMRYSKKSEADILKDWLAEETDDSARAAIMLAEKFARDDEHPLPSGLDHTVPVEGHVVKNVNSWNDVLSALRAKIGTDTQLSPADAAGPTSPTTGDGSGLRRASAALGGVSTSDTFPNARAGVVGIHAEDFKTHPLLKYKLRASQGLYFALNESVTLVKFLAENQHILRNAAALDVGTGLGHVAIYMAEHGAKVVAIDIKQAACEDARYNARHRGLTEERMDVRNGDFDEALKDNEKFDLIVSAPPISCSFRKHGQDSNFVDPGFNLIKRILSSLPVRLKPGGRLILQYPNEAEVRRMNKEYADSGQDVCFSIEEYLGNQLKNTKFQVRCFSSGFQEDDAHLTSGFVRPSPDAIWEIMCQHPVLTEAAAPPVQGAAAVPLAASAAPVGVSPSLSAEALGRAPLTAKADDASPTAQVRNGMTLAERLRRDDEGDNPLLGMMDHNPPAKADDTSPKLRAPDAVGRLTVSGLRRIDGRISKVSVRQIRPARKQAGEDAGGLRIAEAVPTILAANNAAVIAMEPYIGKAHGLTERPEIKRVKVQMDEAGAEAYSRILSLAPVPILPVALEGELENEGEGVATSQRRIHGVDDNQPPVMLSHDVICGTTETATWQKGLRTGSFTVSVIADRMHKAPDQWAISLFTKDSVKAEVKLGDMADGQTPEEQLIENFINIAAALGKPLGQLRVAMWAGGTHFNRLISMMEQRDIIVMRCSGAIESYATFDMLDDENSKGPDIVIGLGWPEVISGCSAFSRLRQGKGHIRAASRNRLDRSGVEDMSGAFDFTDEDLGDYRKFGIDINRTYTPEDLLPADGIFSIETAVTGVEGFNGIEINGNAAITTSRITDPSGAVWEIIIQTKITAGKPGTDTNLPGLPQGSEGKAPVQAAVNTVPHWQDQSSGVETHSDDVSPDDLLGPQRPEDKVAPDLSSDLPVEASSSQDLMAKAGAPNRSLLVAKVDGPSTLSAVEIIGEFETSLVKLEMRRSEFLQRVLSLGSGALPDLKKLLNRRKNNPEAFQEQTVSLLEETIGTVNAARIHDENMEIIKYMPEMRDKTMLCHIIAEPAVPPGQRNMLHELGQEMKKEDDMREKIVSLKIQNPDDPDEFMAKLEEARQKEEKFYKDKGYDVEFDVACHRQDLVARIQDRYKVKVEDRYEIKVNALAFARAEGADAIQVEGIMLALRALRTNDIGRLLTAYKLITGQDISTSRTDINELVREMLFVMPAAIDINHIDTLNRLIKENIWQAA